MFDRLIFSLIFLYLVLLTSFNIIAIFCES